MPRSQRPRLDPEIVAGFRRRRITDALAELCVEQGFRATTIQAIAKRAATSRVSIYGEFENREAIFLVLFDAARDELFTCLEGACADADPERRLDAAVEALLSWVAERPKYAWALFVESTCATPESLRRYFDAISRATDLLAGSAPRGARPSRASEESLVGGTTAIVSGLVRAGTAESAPLFLPNLLDFLKGPGFDPPAAGSAG